MSRRARGLGAGAAAVDPAATGAKDDEDDEGRDPAEAGDTTEASGADDGAGGGSVHDGSVLPLEISILNSMQLNYWAKGVAEAQLTVGYSYRKTLRFTFSARNYPFKMHHF